MLRILKSNKPSTSEQITVVVKTVADVLVVIVDAAVVLTDLDVVAPVVKGIAEEAELNVPAIQRIIHNT